MPTYTSNDRIIKADHTKGLFKETATIVLDNSDQALKDVDMKGDMVNLKWGFLINGTPISAPTGSLKIMEQLFESREGILLCTLECKGIVSLLDLDKANQYWECDEDSTVQDLIEGIVGATLAPYNHCQAYDMVVHQMCEIYKTLCPGTNFVISLNESRLDVLQYLLEHTDLRMRVERDDKIHLYKDTELCYEYSLDGEHVFYTKDDHKRLITPNKYCIVSDEKEENGEGKLVPKYQGCAGSGEFVEYESINVHSNEEAVQVAEAILANIQASARVLEVSVPMHCYADVYDYVKVTDEREGTSVEGHIGQLSRHFSPGYYRMGISFGWPTTRKIRNFLKPYTPDTTGRLQFDELPASFSAAYMNPYDFMVFGQFHLDAGERLYFNAAGLHSGNGEGNLKFLVQGYIGGDWTTLSYLADDFFGKWAGQLIYTNESAYKVPMRFVVYNNSEDETATGVTGFISYDVKAAPSE